MPSPNPVVRAIDVGYGYTKFTLGSERSGIRCAHFPSQACPSLVDKAHDELMGPRKTVSIPLNGVFYEVGPEIALAGYTFRASHGHDRYIETPEYLALMRGALRMMKVEHIDLLVVGLPVALFRSKRTALEKLASGRHEVAPGQFVTVRKAAAVAQPQGALACFASQTGPQADVLHKLNLVVDPGYRTFDWLASQGMRLINGKSHSINRGMLDMVKTMCRKISLDLNVDYRNLDELETALRTGKGPRVGQQTYDLTLLTPITKAIARQAVFSMAEWLGDVRDFDNIVLVGGAASIFREPMRDAFPKHTVHEVREPLYANVRGFHLAGIDRMLAEKRSPDPQIHATADADFHAESTTAPLESDAERADVQAPQDRPTNEPFSEVDAKNPCAASRQAPTQERC